MWENIDQNNSEYGHVLRGIDLENQGIVPEYVTCSSIIKGDITSTLWFSTLSFSSLTAL